MENKPELSTPQKQTLKAVHNFIDTLELIEKTSCEALPGLIVASVESGNKVYQITIQRGVIE